MKYDGESIGDYNRGLNFKYRYELDPVLGVITSFTYTKQNYNESFGDIILDVNVNYYSLLVGPSLRFNEFVSIYAMVGVAKVSSPSTFDDPNLAGDLVKKTKAGYAVGLQFNPVANISLDASYEYVKMDETTFGTWVFGGGYRF